MPVITLPDGSQRQFNQPVTVMQVAEDIGPGLAKATLAAEIDGQMVDTSFKIDHDVTLRLISAKDKEGLELLRHSAAHLLAQAVKQLYPQAQVTIGPVIEDGFYYDFAIEHHFSPEDLEKIEARMKAIAKQKLPVTRQVVSRDEAIQFFETQGEYYKAEIIRDMIADQALTLYTQGDFTDLCRGPHVPHLGHLKVFKLLKVAGAYWRGDSNNAMLQRIYGTAWASKDDLKSYLIRLQEAEKRDHRRIAKQLGLFHQQEEAPGMIFWHPHGWTIWQVMERYMQEQQRLGGYQEIKTPQIVDYTLWERSGHADKYRDNMFSTHSEKREYAIKPMSCPCHVQVFNQGLRSYRDLPLRLAEFGCCHRNEPSGSLHGLFRVRSMVQDDGHVFCTSEQIESEVRSFMKMAFQVYKDFGLTDIRICLATRPGQYIGSDAMWDQAEQALAQALERGGVDFEWLPGEGAFYGPKIELHLKDCLGREWQCGTVQLDFNMPKRLGAEYVTENNDRQTPVMIHRAVLGSFERFLGMLIEHFEGKFPPWLAPIQVVAMGVTDRQRDYVNTIVQALQAQGFRVEADLRNEKIGFKIREHTLQKIPYLLIIGDREMEQSTVSVRTRGGKEISGISLDEFKQQLSAKIAEKGRGQLED
jgi:threonyl-tRNA synthetase